MTCWGPGKPNDSLEDCQAMGSLNDRITMTAQDRFVGLHICPGPAKALGVALEALFRGLCQRLEGTALKGHWLVAL